MRDLVYVSAQPTDKYFVWQVAMWLESLERIGEVDKAHVILYTPKNRYIPRQWGELNKLYPTASFAIYEDSSIESLLPVYIPILRPTILEKYFKERPDLYDKAVLYLDSDIVFTKKPNLDKYLDDDVCYLSDTNSYINSDYIIGKERDVLPERKEFFQQVDVLQNMCKIVGISKRLPIKYNKHSGGAQYLLKNIDAAFWAKVRKDTMAIRLYLMNDINKKFFENEDKGYQSWCADMWGVLYNIWWHGMDTRVVPEMDFAWSTDRIEKLEQVSILHNAGIDGSSSLSTWEKDEEGKAVQVKSPAFYKGKFANGDNPLKHEGYLQNILNNEVTKKYCNHAYTEFLMSMKDKLVPVLSAN